MQDAHERTHVVVLITSFYGQGYLTECAKLAEVPVIHIFMVPVQGIVSVTPQ